MPLPSLNHNINRIHITSEVVSSTFNLGHVSKIPAGQYPLSRMSGYTVSRPCSVWVMDTGRQALESLGSPTRSSVTVISSFADQRKHSTCSTSELYPNLEVPAGLLVPLSKLRAVSATITLAMGVFLHVSSSLKQIDVPPQILVIQI